MDGKWINSFIPTVTTLYRPETSLATAVENPFSQMKGARHLAKQSSADASASVPVVSTCPPHWQKHGLEHAHNLSLYMRKLPGQNRLGGLPCRTGTSRFYLFPEVGGTYGQRDRQRKRDSRGQQNAKGQKAALPSSWMLCSAQISCKKKIYPSNYLVSVFFWAFLFWKLFVLSLILQFGFTLNVKHNLILQAWRCVIIMSHWLVRHCFSKGVPYGLINHWW